MIVQLIVEKALKKAQAAQAVMLTQETSAVDFENDRLKSAQSSQRTQIDVKVILDGKVGVSSTTDPQDVDGVVSRALEAAQFGSPAQRESKLHPTRRSTSSRETKCWFRSLSQSLSNAARK